MKFKPKCLSITGSSRSHRVRTSPENHLLYRINGGDEVEMHWQPDQ